MKSFIKKNIFNSLVLLSGTLLIFTGCEKSFLKADPLSFYEPELGSRIGCRSPSASYILRNL